MKLNEKESLIKKQELNLRATNIGKVVQAYTIISEEIMDELIYMMYEKDIFELRDEIVPLYRGIIASDPVADIMHYNPDKFLARLSQIGVPPILEYFMSSGFKEWLPYPPRHKALVCSFSKENAAKFTSSNNDLYVVIPITAQYVGICPEEDLVDSFEIGMNYAGFKDVYVFFDAVVEIISTLLMAPKDAIHKEFYHIATTTSSTIAHFKDLEMMFDKVDEEYLDRPKADNRPENEKVTELRKKYPKFFNIIDQEGGLLFACAKILNPQLNGFSRVLYTNLSQEGFANDDKECWISGQAVLIRYSKYLKLIDRHSSV